MGRKTNGSAENEERFRSRLACGRRFAVPSDLTSPGSTARWTQSYLQRRPHPGDSLPPASQSVVINATRGTRAHDRNIVVKLSRRPGKSLKQRRTRERRSHGPRCQDFRSHGDDVSHEVLEKPRCSADLDASSASRAPRFEVPRGEIFLHHGPCPGSGKSTLVRHVNRLIEPTSRARSKFLGKNVGAKISVEGTARHAGRRRSAWCFSTWH